MTATIPTEHLDKLHAATTDQLTQVRDHNDKRARQDYAAGRYADADRWYAYVDTCQAIIDERRYGPAPTPMAAENQVDDIAKLLVRRNVDSGFSGLVPSLYRDGNVDLDAVRKLTRDQASQVIDSLEERY